MPVSTVMDTGTFFMTINDLSSYVLAGNVNSEGGTGTAPDPMENP